MDLENFKEHLCGFLGCKDKSLDALIQARTQIQTLQNALTLSKAETEGLEEQLSFASKDAKERLAENNELKVLTKNYSAQLVEMQLLAEELRLKLPEKETAITQLFIRDGKLVEHVFHTSRPLMLQGSWKAQHFDVRKFGLEGCWAMKAWCQLILDEFPASTPQEAMLSVFKWQATHVQYMTDEEKWREGDNWGLAWEVLLTDPGQYPFDSTFYQLLRDKKLKLWLKDDCESKSHLVRALCRNMKYVDEKLAIPDEQVWVSYGYMTGFGHSWVVYWHDDAKKFRILEATSSIPMSNLSNGYEWPSPSYSEYFSNNSSKLVVRPGKTIEFG